MTALELAVRSRSNLELLYRSAILEDAPKARRDRRVRLTANVQLDGIHRALSVDPDELFGLRFLNTEEETYFMFERDRGEMPIERHRNIHQTHFAKKMAIYLAANRQGIHTRELGIPHFRVVTVTTTPARVEQMIDSLARLTEGRGSNMLLFGDQESLKGKSPLDFGWISGKGELLRITD